MAHRVPSSSITYKWKYDVFLSFYGDDTRLGFISHLYASLDRSGIHAFIDYKIRDGENITPALFRAIEESRIAIIVFSKNYANSTFCLRELEKIVECFKEESRLIYPVFYHVDPSDLRKQGGSYAKALAQLEENRFKDERHKVEKWRQALSQAAELKGCHLKPKDANEQECISRITNEVTTIINREHLDITTFPVGLESRVKEVNSFLDLQSTKEIKMIGIWGPGGIGKSTIARAVYNSIADNFESSCFLSNVRKLSKESNGLSRLQETLLSKLVKAKDLNFGDYHEGIPIIQRRLSQKKILLILDDVDESDQLKALARSCNWFGCGSRIIFTTKDKQLLESHNVKSIYEVNGLNDEDSLKLLCWYAFRKENMDSNYIEVCNRAIQLSCGFPIVLEVIGSNLCGKRVDFWSAALDQFKREPHRIVFDTLKLSYDTLQDAEKQVFLDLACLFNGEKLAYVTDILRRGHATNPKYAIEVLSDKSLIKFERDRVIMHDLIEDLGKEIVRRESNEPGKRSRLWLHEDIRHVLQNDTGTDKVEAIILDLPESIEVQWSGVEFLKMKNLKILVIKKACFSKRPKHLPNSLTWLEWKGYPFKSLPTQNFPDLSHMNLRNCEFLQQIPDLSGACNLSELRLDGCTNLIEIHDSVGRLNKLRELSAMRCKNLKILPSCLRLTSLEHLNLFGCSSLQTFPEISVVMKELQTLDLEKTAITKLPSSVCNLIGLETLSVEKCSNLKQLPASICALPNLWKLTTDFCEGLSHFKMREGGDEASLHCSSMSLKMEWLYFSNCNLSDDSLAFCVSHFTNMIHLDLSFNNFTILPKCIEECHNLKFLLLNNCIQLKHIEGMPPNLDKFSAICCKSLTESSKSKVLEQALNTHPGKKNFIFPREKLPERLHYCNQGSSVSFWVRNLFPMASLWILFKDHGHDVCNREFSVRINGCHVDIVSSMWLSQPRIMTDHIYICDMQSIILSTELPLVNKWNQVEISFESEARKIYLGVHVYNLQSNLENIQFMDPRRYIIDPNLRQKIQEQEDWKEVKEDMNLDSNSTKYVGSLNNPMHYKERDIMEKFRPYWDLEFFKVDGHSYNNLIELHQINCKNCWRLPALGQLPALRTLTIEGLESVVAIGSDFFHGDDSASLVPFPSLETLHFENMISWEEWNSIDMDAFPKLHTLRFHGCPKLIGNLPRRLRFLKSLEIEDCPLLSSSVPKSPTIYKLLIIKSPNVVLQEQERLLYLNRLTISGTQMSEPLFAFSIPNFKYMNYTYMDNLLIIKSPTVVLQERKCRPHLKRLTISGTQMSELLFEKLYVDDLIVRGEAVPLPVIHMPHSMEGLTIADCENVKFDLASKAPLYYLQRIFIYNCKFLRSLFDDMKRLLPILKELFIEGCPELEPFSITLPSSLKRLEIRECDKLLSGLTVLRYLPTRVLGKLLSGLTELHHLPTITQLCIYFPSKTWYCNGLRHLTSLQELQILDSPNFEKIEGEIMPPSLQSLHICRYGFLLESCRDNEEDIGPEISNDLIDLEIGTSSEDRDMNDTTIQVIQAKSETSSHKFRRANYRRMSRIRAIFNKVLCCQVKNDLK